LYVLRTAVREGAAAERLAAPARSTAVSRREGTECCSNCGRRGWPEYEEMEGYRWRWPSIDGALLKAPMARESSGPTHPPGEKKKMGPQRVHAVGDGGVPCRSSLTQRIECCVSELAATMDANRGPRRRWAVEAPATCARRRLVGRGRASRNARSRLHSRNLFFRLRFLRKSGSREHGFFHQ